MPSFNERFGFNSGPFENYVAENEPDILEYAVVPPYFEVARRRALNSSSHILFGARGFGKSATRLSTEKDIWKELADAQSAPLVVPFIDFGPLLDHHGLSEISLDLLVRHISFLTIEALLLWLTDEAGGPDLLDVLDDDETSVVVALAKAFYFPVPQSQRRISHDNAMKLLNQNWVSRTKLWVDQNWQQIAKVLGAAADKIGVHDSRSVSEELRVIIDEKGRVNSPSAVLSRLVEAVQYFGFSGISVFVDKVDEHPKTQASPDQAAQVIYPILGQVQLLEIEKLGWQFFLWDRMKPLLSSGQYQIRMDKIASSQVAWSNDFLKSMVNERVRFFSSGRLKSLSDIIDDELNADSILDALIELAKSSPRELIRILDIVVREFDASHYGDPDDRKLNLDDFESGMDKYVTDVTFSVYDESLIHQILRVGSLVFVNKDIQQIFRISAGGATNKITKWISQGAVEQSGTRAATGDSGGKPANEYSVCDPRIVRMFERKLYDDRKVQSVTN